MLSGMKDYRREDWQRLGRAVRQSRRQAGWRNSSEWGSQVGRSTRVLLGLERGEPVGGDTLQLIEYALGWPTGTTDKMLKGEENERAPDYRVADVDLGDDIVVRLPVMGRTSDELRRAAQRAAEAAGRAVLNTDGNPE